MNTALTLTTKLSSTTLLTSIDKKGFKRFSDLVYLLNLRVKARH